MDYELCKKLKDAGYPFQEITEVVLAARGIALGQIQNKFSIGGTYYFEPTLSELIEACGKGFYKLEFITREAGNKRDIWLIAGQGNTPQLLGKTPERAVIELFLKLNPKK